MDITKEIDIEEIKTKNSTIIKNFNPELCMSRKNKLFGLYEQCNHKKKEGNLCGRHDKCKDKLLVTEEIPENLLKI